jgi:Flp pilus assembly protein CpaB
VENIMSSKLFRTRQGTILLGVAAAVLAAIALVVYLHQYRNSVKGSAVTERVLVAKKLIRKNTSGDIVASTGLYTYKLIAKDQLATGTFVDTSELAGKVAVTDVNPGDQLTAADFATGSTSVATQLTKGERAVVVPLDSPSDVDGQVQAGDSVDVMALITQPSGASMVREILQNMYVLGVGTDGNVTIRATPRQAAELIYASGNEKIWLTLRPPVGTVTKPTQITLNNLLGR